MLLLCLCVATMDLEQIVDLGERLGYTGKALQEFVQNERTKQDDLARVNRDREERLAKRQQEKDEAERAHELLLVDKQREVLEAKLKLANSYGKKVDHVQVGKVKLPPFDDHKDQLDAYVERFERYVSSREIPKAQWAVELSALLQDKALQVYTRMPVEEALSYDKLKAALLKRFQMTKDGYRLKFRTCRPEKGETRTQFVTRLSSYLDHWVHLSESHKTYEGIIDLLMREQFVQSCNKDMVVFLKEHECKTIDEMAEVAERYADARGLGSF